VRAEQVRVAQAANIRAQGVRAEQVRQAGQAANVRVQGVRAEQVRQAGQAANVRAQGVRAEQVRVAQAANIRAQGVRAEQVRQAGQAANVRAQGVRSEQVHQAAQAAQKANLGRLRQPHTTQQASDVDQLFAELLRESPAGPDGRGELKGTSTGDFQSPKPLKAFATKPVIKTLDGKAVRESAGARTQEGDFQSASAQTNRSFLTAIRADVGESEAYKRALEKGEIGLQRPGGANVPGADFITAAEGPDGIRIYVNDAKTSTTGKFPKDKGPYVKLVWAAEVHNAVARLDLGDPVLEARIRKAAADPTRIQVRQINVDYSPAGQGKITGY
jgi:hypothetical protein